MLLARIDFFLVSTISDVPQRLRGRGRGLGGLEEESEEASEEESREGSLRASKSISPLSCRRSSLDSPLNSVTGIRFTEGRCFWVFT